MSFIRPRRSVLYVPASNAKALHKVASLPCDSVILDLEDAVAPEMKETARVAAIEAVRSRRFGQREVIVRVNAFDVRLTPASIATVTRTLHHQPDLRAPAEGELR